MYEITLKVFWEKNKPRILSMFFLNIYSFMMKKKLVNMFSN